MMSEKKHTQKKQDLSKDGGNFNRRHLFFPKTGNAVRINHFLGLLGWIHPMSYDPWDDSGIFSDP